MALLIRLNENTRSAALIFLKNVLMFLKYVVYGPGGEAMNHSRRSAKLITIAIFVALYAVATFSNQEPNEPSSAARERIERARASVVQVKAIDESNQTSSQAVGFFIRKDLIVTDHEILDRKWRLQVTAATKPDPVRVLSSGDYFLPYVLVENQADAAPVTLGDSERVLVNDPVYMFGDAGKIVSGKVIGTTTIKNTRAFVISLPVDANNKGTPIFNHMGQVIGIAAKSGDGQSAGLAWPSDLLASLKHLGEPGVGAGAGDGPPFRVVTPERNADDSAAGRVDTKPVRLNSPRPRYTEAARANRTSGSVAMRILVGEDGNVKGVRVVRGLPDGLTEEAITVARETKFKPAMKDGKPVAYWVALEITFNIR